MKSHVQDTAHVQEPRVSVHKRGIHIFDLFEPCHVHVNNAKEIVLVEIQELSHCFSVTVEVCCPCLEYLVTFGDGVITVNAEAATNRVAPVLSSSEPVTLNFIAYAQKIYLYRTLNVSSLKEAIYTLYDCLNPVF